MTASTRPAHPARLRRALRALEQLLGGFGTALLALPLLVGALTIGWTRPAGTLRLVHALAERERDRLRRWDQEVVTPGGPRPVRLADARSDPATRGEVRWLLRHSLGGAGIGFLAALAPLSAVRDLTFPLWWWALPDGYAGPSLGFWVVRDWSGVPAVVLLGVAWTWFTIGVLPAAARRQLRVNRRLLSDDDADLTTRVAELTRTRAAALDAHAAELRRIERSLHDGAQNRIVAATVLIGAARRSLDTGATATGSLLDQAQDAAELALAELRAVVRSILPPVLADRGLAGAVHGLAAASPVPCTVEVDLPERCAASVEATLYFVVAEALTNVARHSDARQARVSIRRRRDGVVETVVSDDGRGGAREGAGSGLAGIRDRVEAMDGRWSLASPPGGPTRLRVEVPCGS